MAEFTADRRRIHYNLQQTALQSIANLVALYLLISQWPLLYPLLSRCFGCRLVAIGGKHRHFLCLLQVAIFGIPRIAAAENFSIL